MPTIALVPKSVQSNRVDIALCRRLAQEASRRASAAESWATLVFGRLGRERIAIEFATELAELAEKDTSRAKPPCVRARSRTQSIMEG